MVMIFFAHFAPRKMWLIFMWQKSHWRWQDLYFCSRWTVTGNAWSIHYCTNVSELCYETSKDSCTSNWLIVTLNLQGHLSPVSVWPCIREMEPLLVFGWSWLRSQGSTHPQLQESFTELAFWVLLNWKSEIHTPQRVRNKPFLIRNLERKKAGSFVTRVVPGDRHQRESLPWS